MDSAVLGSLALWASLPLAALVVVLGLARRNAVPAAWALAASLTVAVGALVVALLGGDFRLVYVADTTSRSASWPSRVAALWGGMEGSLLFWTWLLGLAALAGVRLARRDHPPLAGATATVLGSTVGAFAAVGAVLAPPFALLAIPAIDGGGLVPILERPAMLYHPPLLYGGLVVLAVPFALGVAGLVGGDLGRSWIRSVRATTGVAWVLLTLGMVAGAHWAYGELGWGGFWAWDPIENASLLPWLAATALLHAVLVDAYRCRRGVEQAARLATGALATLPFVLVTIGSVLTRSGAAPSVHAFAEAEAVGIALLGLVVVATTTAVAAIALAVRSAGPTPGAAGGHRTLRDRAMGVNGVLLAAAGLVVLTGTLYPLVAGMGDEPVAVAGSFFARFTAPVAVAVVALLGVAPYLRPSGGATAALQRAAPAAAAAAVASSAVAWLVGARQPFALAVAPLAAGSAMLLVADGFRRIRDGSLPRLAGLGGTVAHLGAVVLVAGFAGSTAAEERGVVLGPGATTSIGAYTVRNDGVEVVDAPGGGRRVVLQLGVRRSGEPVGPLAPAQVVFAERGLVRADPALRSTPLEDLQVVLRRVDVEGVAAVDLAVRPLVTWIWLGGLLVPLGGGIALVADRREPVRVSPPDPRACVPAGAPPSPAAR